MILPDRYIENMKKLLSEEEFSEYMASLDKEPFQGLRVNTLKISSEDFLELWGEELKPISWCPEGFYLEGGTRTPSKDPYYFGGLYYLQEPSAMAPASILPVEPGDRVLDLCAAPGGKSTHLAARLKGEGILISNDISASRAKALLKNLELFGVKNAAVVSEAPYRLAEAFPEYFNKILIDAPCSGEGMFRKSPVIMKNWEQYGNGYYAKLQDEILEHAVKMLAPGGMLLYSTCTFAPMENEQSVHNLLKKYPGLRIKEFAKAPGIGEGNPGWIEEGEEDLRKTARFWPHRIQGEGHYAALLEKEGQAGSRQERSDFSQQKGLDCFYSFVKEYFQSDIDEILSNHSKLYMAGERLFATVIDPHHPMRLRILRNGLLLGEVKKDRFEPSQALALTLKKEDMRSVLNYKHDDDRVLRYLKGETLQGEFTKGWNLVCVDGFPLGWGKASGALLKNKYLKGWRYQ